MLKKIKYVIENYIYKFRYGKEIDLEEFSIKENNFSGKSLNIIYLSYFDGPYSYNNVVKVLEELGDVFRYEMTQNPHEKDWYLRKDRINKEMLKFIQKTIEKNKIDVIVCYLSGHSTSPKVLNTIKSYKIPMINESLDDERKFKSRKGKDGIYRGNKDICKYFNITLTTSKSAIIKYLVEGGRPLYKDYCGNEKIYRKLNVLKEYDVSFIGASYGVRGEYIEYLQNNGINVYTKGNGWNNGFATDKEMIDIFNKSKIVLGFSTVGRNDDIFILKGRDFEVPLTGSFYLTRYHEELEVYFDITKEIGVYTSKSDLLDKVRYYLEHEENREIIANNAYKKCLEKYTAKASYEKVFGFLGL